MPLLLAAVALVGLAVGSFLNVVIHRVPRGESLATPGSHCPGCGNAVRARHNVPVIGWLMLHGRCADCGEPISARYPLIELITAVLFVLTSVQVAALHLLPALPAYLFFVAAGIALAAIDLNVMRLPNRIVYPSYVAVGTLLALAAVADGSAQPLVRASVAAAVCVAFYFALALAKPGGMGLGDVKLAGVIGAVLGFLSYPAVVIGVFAGFMIGAVAGIVLLVMRRAGRTTLVPFGPAMIAGSLVAIFATAPLLDVYRTFTRQS